MKTIWSFNEIAFDIQKSKGYLCQKFKNSNIFFIEDGQKKYFSIYDGELRKLIFNLKNINPQSELLKLFSETEILPKEKFCHEIENIINKKIIFQKSLF